MPLKGIKVLEFAGLAPGPFCGMILSDFGATVTKIDRSFYNPIDRLDAGKRKLALNIKHDRGQEIARQLCRTSDVLIEPFRPGVMEKLNLGPDRLLEENPRLIYARLTGFGQTGPLSARAGHDINYMAVSGVLSMLGKHPQPPMAPVNLIADFAGGGLMCAFGICVALIERAKSDRGQIIDSSMTEGAAYVASWLMRAQSLPIWGKPRGHNILDGGAFFYGAYETSDGKYMSVGALEAQFFDEFTRILGLSGKCNQFDDDGEYWRQKITEIFKTKTQKEWAELFEAIDACVFPVVEWKTAKNHPQNQSRESFICDDDATIVPSPAPKLSRTPAVSSVKRPIEENFLTQTETILSEIGIERNEVKQLGADGIINFPGDSKL